MEMQRLRYFVAVAEELHFGRASEQLGIAQPPLSRQIARLEKELQASLFDRSRSQIKLTQAGKSLLERAVVILNDYDDACLEIKRIGQGASGRLRIAFVGSATHGLFPSLIKSFRANYPKVNLVLLSMNNAEMLRSLAVRSIDIAISRPEIENDEIHNKFFFKEDLVLAIPDSITIKSGKRLLFSEMKDETFILYPEFPRPSFADFILSICAEAGFEPKNRAYTMDYQTAISLVAVGEGISLVPASVASSKRTGVRFVEYIGPNPGTGLSISYRRDNQDPIILNFANLAQKLARKPDINTGSSMKR
ncbi:MAG: LysR family transcriptional regulator [Alphaproteobacteria bacterium]|nr:LysR family transcriptional regulator [Alphaproteobacteria bacterium]